MIKSSPFGGVTLTGDDAQKFERQVRYGRAGAAARRSLEMGDKLLKATIQNSPLGPVLVASPYPVDFATTDLDDATERHMRMGMGYAALPAWVTDARMEWAKDRETERLRAIAAECEERWAMMEAGE